MGHDTPQDMIIDIGMRIELRRLADRAQENNNAPLAAILEVAINSLDERIGDPSSYGRIRMPLRRTPGLICRNIRLGGRRTSVKLEQEFWDALERIAAKAGCSVDDLCRTARQRQPSGTLTSAIRVFVMTSQDSGIRDCRPESD